MAKTALELTPDVLRTYHPARNRSETRPELDERRARAWAMAREAARLLREDFGASRVLVFGSLTQPDLFSPWSDIDLAAYGVSPLQFYRAVAVVSGLSAEFKIDLVDPALCRGALGARIAGEGREI